MSTYVDKAKCPAGHKFKIDRRITTAGKTVTTYCRICKLSHLIKAGPAPTGDNKE